MSDTVSIIMPAFNEGAHICDNIRMTREVMTEAGLPAEIVVVDDGSSDNTLEEMKRAAQECDNVIVARNPYNMGKGMALRTGFDYSGGDIVVFLDADLDLHPSQIQTLISVLEEAPCDIVVTSKHHPESHLEYPLFRKAASWAYYMLIKVLFGLPVRDTQTGLKVFRREVLLTIFHRLLVKKFAYDVELLATAVRFGYRVQEIPVVLDFKRDLSWGRIKAGDIISIFVDTVAIFYRLNILRYYDAERPPMPHEEKNVLIVVYGCSPPDDVITRLSLDAHTRIACISDEQSSSGNIMTFPTRDRLTSWLRTNNKQFEIIGFLGNDLLPVGSWVKNAVRNFENPDVLAVCGPLIPGPFSSRRGKAAGLLVSSVITTGPESYLNSLRGLRTVPKGMMKNMFVRSDYLNERGMKQKDLSIDGEYVYDSTPCNIRLKYDPDVAVSKQVPPLFLPYLRMAARDAFLRGFYFFRSHRDRTRWWGLIPPAVWFLILFGLLVVPVHTYINFMGVLLIIVIVFGLSCFDLLTAPLFMAGIVLEYFVRALAFPSGMIIGAVKRGNSRSEEQMDV